MRVERVDICGRSERRFASKLPMVIVAKLPGVSPLLGTRLSTVVHQRLPWVVWYDMTTHSCLFIRR